MNKRAVLLIVLVLALGALWWQRSGAASAGPAHAAALAVGLRDDMEVKRRLSKSQQKRLDENFLPAAALSRPSAASGPGDVLETVRRINALNAGQREKRR